MDYVIEIVERQREDTAVVTGHVAVDGIGAFVGAAFGDVMAALGGRVPAGMPFARYAMVDDGFDIEAGFPVAGPIAPSGRVAPGTLPGGTVATVMHVGPYGEVSGAYEALEQWLAANGWTPDEAPWEAYFDGPEVAEPRTLVSWACHREG